MRTDHSTKFTVNETNEIVNKWWNNTSLGVKELFSGINSNKGAEDHYRLFWNKLHATDQNNIYHYWQYCKGIITMTEDDANSLQMEVICELADIVLEMEYDKPREDMCDDEGSFYEEYQDRFNDIYDDIEDRLLNHDFINE